MSKAKEKKAVVIDQLQEKLSSCNIGILTDYRGLTAAEITELRRTLDKSGIEYKVVKNTMARFAAEKAGMGELAGLLQGPVAIAFGYGDIIEPARVLADYTRAAKTSLGITGGFLGSRLLTSRDLAEMATLPPREILLAKVIGRLQSPMYGLVNCLSSPLRGIMGVLQARIEQMEGS